MKAVISTTHDDTYLYFLPIVTWCWNKLGVDVICFLPQYEQEIKIQLVLDVINKNNLNCYPNYFSSPKHKEATYAQCLRNYAACLDLPENELLVTSDVDMALFKIPDYIDDGKFSVFGYDLVPHGQFPQCYVTAPVKAWREAFNLNGKTYQQAIDELLGDDECQDYRGCRWSVDQEQSFKHISPLNHNVIPRARPNTQFADHRVDRDDSFYKERLDKDIIDAHLWRPGYTEENFPKILDLLQYFYPEDNLDWLKKYTEEYNKLL